MQYCPESGKLCFPSRQEAERAARNMQSRRKGMPSVYLCNTCHTFHLTHYNYEHCKAVQELRKSGYYQPRVPKPPNNRNRKNMVIFTDTDSGETLSTDIPNPDDATQLRLAIVEAGKSTHPILLTYHQALELVESIKIQLGKMKM